MSIFEKIRTFFDDPVNNVRWFFVTKNQEQMRKAIAAKYRGDIPEQVYWIRNTPKENEGLSNEPVEQIVQRQYLSQLGYYIAQRMWAKRNFIIYPSLLIFGCFLSFMLFYFYSKTESEYLTPITLYLGFWISFSLFFGSILFAPFIMQFLLPNKGVNSEEINATKEVLKNCLIRDVNLSALPADFQDRLRIGDVDAHGRAVTGQLLAFDFDYCAIHHQWSKTAYFLMLGTIAIVLPVLFTHSIWLFLGAYFITLILFKNLQRADLSPDELQQIEAEEQQNPSLWLFIFKIVLVPIFAIFSNHALTFPMASTMLFDATLINATASVLAVILSFIGWLLMLFFVLKDESPLKQRADILEQSVKQSGTELLIDKVGRAYFQNLEQAKIAQLENVARDKSPLFTLGKSTGLLAQRRDPFAPSEAGLPVCLSVNDISTHILTIGASGTGKTSGVIRPIASQWIDVNAGGLFVLDGKGVLPAEFKNLKDFQLISPNANQFNPIFGMQPDSVADCLSSIFTSDAEVDPFWSQSAAYMLRMAAIVCHANDDFTLTSIFKLCIASKAEQLKVIIPLKSLSEQDDLIFSACHYFLQEVPEMPDKTLGSIINMVRTWLGSIVNHAQLGKWVNCSEGVMIEDVFTGSKMGINLPESEYGAGGLAISALCLRRLYDAAKRRGEGWKNTQKPVLLIADEVQNLLTKADLENVAIARSLGLYLMFATQNIDGLYKRLDEQGAKQMLGNFASMVIFPPRTKASNEYASERASKIWKASIERFNGLPDTKSDFNLYLQSGAEIAAREITLFNQAQVARPRLAYTIGIDENSHKNLGFGGDGMVTFNPTMLIDADEIEGLLSKPQTALCLLTRGRVQRRDVVQLDLKGAME